eukprot:COSAG01_NODE_31660_length_593_cov_1.518219_1_plen_136_part_01
MTSTSPLRTGVPACVMGLLREEAGSQHLAMSQRSPQFSQALNEFCSGLIKCYEDAHLDYKEEIAALFDKAEDESDRSATEAPAPAQPFVPTQQHHAANWATSHRAQPAWMVVDILRTTWSVYAPGSEHTLTKTRPI